MTFPVPATAVTTQIVKLTDPFLLASVSEPFSVVSCQFLSWTTGGPGLPHTANMLTFLFHLHARAATECMRPKVILRRLERHQELQWLRVSGELAEAREGRLESRREL